MRTLFDAASKFLILFHLIFLLGLSGCLDVQISSDVDSAQLAPVDETPTEPEVPMFHTPFNSDIPIVTGGAAAMTVRHTCGVLKNSRVMCWGSNVSGQLGDGTFVDSTEPVLVVGGTQGGTYLENVIKLTAGHSHTCVVDTAGDVYCWGKGGTILGQGVNTANLSEPTKVTTGDQGAGSGFLENAIDVGAGYDFTCALINSKRVYCWGIGGRLGAGNGTAYNFPKVVVTGEQADPSGFLENVRQLGVGFRNTCVVTDSDEPFCWGDGRGTGIGNTAIQNSPVRPLSGQQGGGPNLINIRQVTGGWNRSCAVTNDGGVYCWGANTDDFGHDGSPADTPVRVLKGQQATGNDGIYLGNIRQVEGTSTYCAISNNDDFYCWGTNLNATPSYVTSSLFDSGYMEGIKSMSFVLSTTWVFDNTDRPMGLGFNYFNTFLDEPSTFLFEPYFLDLEE